MRLIGKWEELYFEATCHRLFAIIFKLVALNVSFIIRVTSAESPIIRQEYQSQKGEESGGIWE
jgi:hypothetical protein